METVHMAWRGSKGWYYGYGCQTNAEYVYITHVFNRISFKKKESLPTFDSLPLEKAVKEMEKSWIKSR